MTAAELTSLTGLTPDMLLILILPICGALLLLLAAFGGDEKRKKYKELVTRASGKRKAAPAAAAQQISVRVSTSDSSIPALDRFIQRALPRRDQLRRRLARTGLDISLGSYLIICAVVAIAAGGGIAVTGLLPPAAAVLAGLAVGLGLPHILVGVLARRRQARFLNDFPDAIDLMTRGLKSGLPIIESIKTAGDEVPGPVGLELRRVTDSVRLGSKLEDVLWETSERLGVQEFKFFTISLAIQAETGGNLTETLANLADVLRRRRQLKLKIRALSSEAKASAYIIGSLPFIMAVIIYMMNPGYLQALIVDTRGHVMVGMGLFSFLVGAVVMYKMVRFDH